MERVTYEDALLMHYKKYLQKLEKLTSGISKGQRKTSQEYRKMAEIATTCLCELVGAHPYFNFAQNIAQLLVYLSNCNILNIRTKVMECFQQLFREDSKFDLSLFVSKLLLLVQHLAFILIHFLCAHLGRSTFESLDKIQIKYGSC